MKTEKHDLYPFYERVWHWVQAVAVLLLLLTGLEIRDHIRLLGFELSVRMHTALGVFLIINAFLGLFYFLTSGAIRQYVTQPRDFATLAVKQMTYYMGGIFRGAPHPVERTAGQRLNPLQQAVYLIILNVLLPWQIFTGLAIWGLEQWPHLEAAIGGLPILLPLHALGSWLFAAFIIMHVYLTTTSGLKPLDGIKAMILGWEEMPVPEKESDNPEASS